MLLSEETFEEIERRALEISAELEQKLGPYKAEIAPEYEPHWHVITAIPTRENDAVKFLAMRGIGVYLPRFDTERVVRGRLRRTSRILFPGHAFVFVWDVARHWRRIKETPAVMAILTVNERPVIVPDEAINRMQAIEVTGNTDFLKEPKRHRVRKKKNRYYEPEPEPETTAMVTVKCKSHWDKIDAGLTELDDEARLGVLHRALGLVA